MRGTFSSQRDDVSGATLRRKREKGKIRTFSKKKKTTTNLAKDFFPTDRSHGVENGMLAKAESWHLARF